MPERSEDFEEAWARIVADLSPQLSADRDSFADAGSDASDGQSDIREGGSGSSLAPESSDGSSDGSHGPTQASTDGSVEGRDQAADPTRRPDSTPSGRSEPSDPSAGLTALFEPLRRATPPSAPTGDAATNHGAADPGAFVDNWIEEGHFTPPPPPELPTGTPITRLAWCGMLGGPLTLLLMALTPWNPPQVVGLGAGLATLAGFITLVWQLPEAREDDWDDGAQV